MDFRPLRTMLPLINEVINEARTAPLAYGKNVPIDSLNYATRNNGENKGEISRVAGRMLPVAEAAASLLSKRRRRRRNKVVKMSVKVIVLTLVCFYSDYLLSFANKKQAWNFTFERAKPSSILQRVLPR